MNYPVTVRTYDVSYLLRLHYIESAPGVVTRSVFARVDITKGTMVEECPVIPIYANEQTSRINAFRSYAYSWKLSDESGQVVVRDAICAGMGSIYNHSDPGNLSHVEFKIDFRMEFWSITDISKGDELTINYGWGKYAGTRLNPVDRYLRPMNAVAMRRLGIG